MLLSNLDYLCYIWVLYVTKSCFNAVISYLTRNTWKSVTFVTLTSYLFVLMSHLDSLCLHLSSLCHKILLQRRYIIFDAKHILRQTHMYIGFLESNVNTKNPNVTWEKMWQWKSVTFATFTSYLFVLMSHLDSLCLHLSSLCHKILLQRRYIIFDAKHMEKCYICYLYVVFVCSHVTFGLFVFTFEFSMSQNPASTPLYHIWRETHGKVLHLLPLRRICLFSCHIWILCVYIWLRKPIYIWVCLKITIKIWDSDMKNWCHQKKRFANCQCTLK